MQIACEAVIVPSVKTKMNPKVIRSDLWGCLTSYKATESDIWGKQKDNQRG